MTQVCDYPARQVH